MSRRGVGGTTTTTGPSLIIYVIASVLIITAFVLALLAYLEARDLGRDVTLAVDDNTTQLLAGPSIWASIQFHRNLHISSAWDHLPGDSIFKCQSDGIYKIYFSIQTSLPTYNNTNATFYCQSNNLKFQIRATNQYNGVGILHEIRSSRTQSDRDAAFLSKYFIVNLNEGDLLRFQFQSQCSDLSLVSDQPFGTSATLVIS